LDLEEKLDEAVEQVEEPKSGLPRLIHMGYHIPGKYAKPFREGYLPRKGS
jgi:hypothetical protein